MDALDTSLASPWTPLALSLGLGLLIGLQREWTKERLAGIRTFPLISLLGALAAQYGGESTWLIAAGLLAVALLFAAGNLVDDHEHPVDAGLTTEFAGLVMFTVGVICAEREFAVALAVTGVLLLLLHGKRRLHYWVQRVGERELSAVMRLALVGLVILPLLPNQAFDPWGVLNPFRVWLMVVLIVGLSLAGWLGYRLLGARTGALLTGVFGGLISSTATALSAARQADSQPAAAPSLAAVVLIASSVVFVRVLLEIGVVAPQDFAALAPPLVVMLVLMAAICRYSLRGAEGAQSTEPDDPAQLGSAIVFGLMYALVLVLLAWGREQLGDQGLYAMAVISGLTDMDAITLSIAELVRQQQLEADLGWRLILAGGLSNLGFKLGLVAVLGHRSLLLRLLPGFGLATAGGLALILLWPAAG
jgi:uncharacterized membrane protein (DUF4010 family)